MCLVDRKFAEFVKSQCHVLPLDVVSIVAGSAAPDPILECFAMNARLASCVPSDRNFRKAVKDEQHELRRTFRAGLRGPRRRFLRFALATAATTSYAVNRPGRQLGLR